MWPAYIRSNCSTGLQHATYSMLQCVRYVMCLRYVLCVRYIICASYVMCIRCVMCILVCFVCMVHDLPILGPIAPLIYTMLLILRCYLLPLTIVCIVWGEINTVPLDFDVGHVSNSNICFLLGYCNYWERTRSIQGPGVNPLGTTYPENYLWEPGLVIF